MVTDKMEYVEEDCGKKSNGLGDSENETMFMFNNRREKTRVTSAQNVCRVRAA